MDENLTFSYIEESFLNAARPKIRSLQWQVWVDWKYRVDFYIPERRLIVELDGHDYHSSKEQREYDAKRDRYLSKKGFRVIRFTGREVNRDVNKCVQDTIEIADSLPRVESQISADRDMNNPNPDTYQNFSGYCSYMQMIINVIFKKYGIGNHPDAFIRLKIDGYDPLSIGVIDKNLIYIAYSFNLNGDRAVDPEIILYRYFDTNTNRFELIPFSFESFTGFFMELARLDDIGRVEIIDQMEYMSTANYIEGMARRIENAGFLNARVEDFSMGITE
ncbi:MULTISPECIES: endonuclease domain-containing protein [Deinococcus]|uniref:Endonuclease domain-containing protein n=1 Tax=Deinococcus rufus TaxID=2136097 RepID=A0ABV7Z3F9_9DEIO|nr:DUF559 domain-containing protein [Deinococcus sp. AB2017081]WQE94788.1 DUF559 domain-containing protein [Deinococcus sp. AB2017081]